MSDFPTDDADLIKRLQHLSDHTQSQATMAAQAGEPWEGKQRQSELIEIAADRLKQLTQGNENG